MNPNSSAGDQIFTNGYPEITKNPATELISVQFYKRPGYGLAGNTSSVSTACKSGAICTWTGNTSSTPAVMAAFLDTSNTSTSVWDIVSGTKHGASIPTTNECTALTETTINVSTAHLVGNFFDSSTGNLEQWFFTEGAASWVQVTSAPIATRLTGFPAHMDGYTFNMTRDGLIVNSDLNTVSSYSATAFIAASQYPDKGVTVARLGPHIIAFGEKSIERFFNNGNSTGSPLSRVQDGGLPMGAARTLENSTQSVRTLLQSVLIAHSSIYWIGTNSECAPIGIFTFKGQQPEKVSSPAIDKLLVSGSITGFLGSFVSHGMRHVVLKGDTDTWAYCIDTNFWWKIVLASGAINAITSAGVLMIPPVAYSYFTGTNNTRGNVIGQFVDTTDNGSDFTMTVQLGNLDFGTHRRKRWDAVSVIGDTQTSTSPLAISFSDDDYASFSTPRNLDLSATDKRLTRWGASRKRAWKLTHTTSTPLRIEALDFEYELVGP
jgi:hypothetical protein